MLVIDVYKHAVAPNIILSYGCICIIKYKYREKSFSIDGWEIMIT